MVYSKPPFFCLYGWSSTRQPQRGAELERFKYTTLVLTFFAYMSFHISRRPLSIVRGELHRNCTINSTNPAQNSTDWCWFAPFDQPNYEELFGDLDYAFYAAYAVGTFVSGWLADRMSLRYYLTIGMLLSGLMTSLFGVGYYLEIHSFTYYVLDQIVNGFLNASGWPAVIAVVGNWVETDRGLVMALWISNAAFGNAIGAAIASAFVSTAWGLSFIVPGCFLGFMGLMVFFVLVESLMLPPIRDPIRMRFTKTIKTRSGSLCLVVRWMTDLISFTKLLTQIRMSKQKKSSKISLTKLRSGSLLL